MYGQLADYIIKALRMEGYQYWGELESVQDWKLLTISGIGKKALSEIRTGITKFGKVNN